MSLPHLSHMKSSLTSVITNETAIKRQKMGLSSELWLLKGYIPCYIGLTWWMHFL